MGKGRQATEAKFIFVLLKVFSVLFTLHPNRLTSPGISRRLNNTVKHRKHGSLEMMLKYNTDTFNIMHGLSYWESQQNNLFCVSSNRIAVICCSGGQGVARK